MVKLSNCGAKPGITLTAQDHERLTRLSGAAANTLAEVASRLSEKLDRAKVLAKGRHPVDVVCMGSEVVYRDDTTGHRQTTTLVYPNEADSATGKTSVLTPIGTALIGLSVGKSINWQTRTGSMKRLTIIQVREPASVETWGVEAEAEGALQPA